MYNFQKGISRIEKSDNKKKFYGNYRIILF